MILIDALYINNGGGKVLLDYLIEKIEQTNLEVFYLLDSRVEAKIPKIKDSNKVVFMVASLKIRKKFYEQNYNAFSKIFCFGNLAPSKKTKAIVYTYLHQSNYLGFTKNVSLKFKLIFSLKRFLWKKFAPNTNYWLVQTNLMKKLLENKGISNKENILSLPFYNDDYKTISPTKKDKEAYLYVSNAPEHKNHIRLINAFCKFYDISKKGKLILTVSEDFPHLIKLISEKIQLGYPIKNLGLVSRSKVIEVSLASEFVVYPSLTESFGLGLIESVDCGCKIIGSDLPYTFEVCEPSIIFNPYDENSIMNALLLSLQGEIKDSKTKISNKINQLIDLLQ